MFFRVTSGVITTRRRSKPIPPIFWGLFALLCALGITPANAQITDDTVKAQTKSVTDATSALKTALGADADIAKDKTFLETLKSVSVKDDLSDLEDKLTILKGLTAEVAAHLRLIQTNRTTLGQAVATLRNTTSAIGYSLVTGTVRDLATKALNDANTELGRDVACNYTALLGDNATPGEAVKSLQKFYDVCIAACDPNSVGDLTPDTLPTDLLDKIPPGLEKYAKLLPKLSERIALPNTIADKATVASSLLPQESGKTKANALADAAKTLSDRAAALAKSLPGHFDKLKAAVQERSLKIIAYSNDARRRKPGANAVAYVGRQETDAYIAKLDKCLKAWKDAKDAVTNKYKDDSGKTDESVKQIELARDDLNDNVRLMSGLLQSGTQDMVTYEVRLSYFPDTARLVHILNPAARLVDPTNGTAVTGAVSARTSLRSTEANLLEARGKISDVKTRIQRINVEIARAKTAVARTNDIYNKSLGQQQGLTDTKAKLTKQKGEAKADAERQRLQDQIDATDEKIKLQDEIVTAAKKDNDDALASRDTLLNEQTGLPAELVRQEGNQKTAEDALNTLRKDLPGMAQDESDAFARARDNAPYFVAEPIADDPDPVRRIYIFADSSGRILHLRGARDDVKVAREVIAEFDKPAPQTKLTFLTIQMNGDDKSLDPKTSDPNAKRPLTPFAIVDDNLDRIRIATYGVTDALRDSIAEEIDSVAKTLTPAHNSRLTRSYYFAASVQRALGLNGVGENTAQVTQYTLPDPMRLTTLGEMLFVLSLGGKQSRERILTNFQKRVQELTLTDKSPDAAKTGDAKAPSGTTKADAFALADQTGNEAKAATSAATSADAVAIVAEARAAQNSSDAALKATADQRRLEADLAKIKAERTQTVFKQAKDDLNKFQASIQRNKTQVRENKERPAGDFLARFKGALLASIAQILPEGAAGVGNVSVTQLSELRAVVLQFASDELMQSLPLIFGLPRRDPTARGRGPEPTYQEMTPQQKEILDALRAKAKTGVSGTIYNMLKQLDEMPDELRYTSAAATRLRQRYIPLIGWLLWDGNRSGSALPTDWYKEGLSVLGYGDNLPTDEEHLRECDRTAYELARVQFDANPLSKATGRIAAADKMIRNMIDAFNDDLNRLVRTPAMAAIREQVTTKLPGVSFSGIEETSFLATNRRLARVDTLGSGSLSVEETAQFGEAAQTLSNLLTKQKAREETRDSILGAVGTAGIAALAGGNKAVVAGAGITSLISGLLAPSTDAASATASEVYNITSGSVYQITPIFDPTGQGMRFNFDFVMSTRLREPSGTLNPALPRIERHTINTEVALANLDTRPITSFDSNYQIGIPAQRSGGLPLFNTIPAFKDIPIIGYFTKREGQPALRQRSIILAQSILYPTVADLAGLMLDSTALPISIAPEPLGSSRLPSERSAAKSVRIAPETVVGGNPVIITVTLVRPVARETNIKLQFEPGLGLVIPGNSTGAVSRLLTTGQDTAVFALYGRDWTEQERKTAAQQDPKIAEVFDPKTGDYKGASNNSYRNVYQNIGKKYAPPIEETAITLSILNNSGREESVVVKIKYDNSDSQISERDFVVMNGQSPLWDPYLYTKGTFLPSDDDTKKQSRLRPEPLKMKEGAVEYITVELTKENKRRYSFDDLANRESTRNYSATPLDVSIDAPGVVIDGYEPKIYPGQPSVTFPVKIRPDAKPVGNGVGYVEVHAPLNFARIPFTYEIKPTDYSLRASDITWSLMDEGKNPLSVSNDPVIKRPRVTAGQMLTLSVAFAGKDTGRVRLTNIEIEPQIGSKQVIVSNSLLLESRPIPIEFSLPAGISGQCTLRCTVADDNKWATRDAPARQVLEMKIRRYQTLSVGAALYVIVFLNEEERRSVMEEAVNQVRIADANLKAAESALKDVEAKLVEPINVYLNVQPPATP